MGLFKFQNDCACEEVCEECNLIEGYLNIALNSESKEDARSVLSTLYMAGKDIGYEKGYKQSLINDLEAKEDILNQIECGNGCCDCCDCCDCEDGECGI